MSEKTFERDEGQERLIKMFSETDSGAALNGSGTGAGKTNIALRTAINRDAKRVLIIAPPKTFENWEGTIKALLPSVELRPCANQKVAQFPVKECKANLEAAQNGDDGWFFVSREMFNLQNWVPVKNKDGSPKVGDKGKKVVRRADVWHKKRPWDMAIFDEVQIASNRNSRTRQSWAHLKANFKLAQSADWFGSDLENMYTVGDDLWPGHTGMNRTEWIDEYMDTEFDPFSYNKKRIKGELWEGFYASTLPCYAALPSPIDKPEPERRYVDLTPAQRKLYDKLEADMVAEIEGNPLVVDMDMQLTMRLRELTLGMFHVVEFERPVKSSPGETEFATTIDYRPGDPSSTIDEIKAIHRDHNHEPMLVLTHSQKFAAKAAADLGGLPYTGKQTDAQKAEAVRAFRVGETKILVGTEAICEGLDGLQEICRLSVIASRPWRPYMTTQFLGRTARRGQKRPVLAYEIVRRDTIDLGVVSRLLRKTFQLNAAKAAEQKGKTGSTDGS